MTLRGGGLLLARFGGNATPSGGGSSGRTGVRYLSLLFWRLFGQFQGGKSIKYMSSATHVPPRELIGKPLEELFLSAMFLV